jgi:hypothetical protein
MCGRSNRSGVICAQYQLTTIKPQRGASNNAAWQTSENLHPQLSGIFFDHC